MDKEYDREFTHWTRITIDGDEYRDQEDFSAYSTIEDYERSIRLYPRNPKLESELLRQPFSSFPSDLLEIEFNHKSFHESFDIVVKKVVRSEFENLWSIHFEFEAPAHWNKPWSFGHYISLVKSFVSIERNDNIVKNQFLRPFSYIYEVTLEETTQGLGSACERFLPTLLAAGGAAEELLGQRTDAETLQMIFSFPEEIKTSCKQYLLYFAEFLKDLGVEAQAGVTDQAGVVLFKVTPDSKEHAITTIKEALDVYLRLPYFTIETTQNQSLEVFRLSAQLKQLDLSLEFARAQLQLKEAQLESKNATIEAKNVTIETQRALMSGKLLIPASDDSESPSPETPEDLIPRLVSLSVLEEKGVRVNLGELLRKLKGLFKKDL